MGVRVNTKGKISDRIARRFGFIRSNEAEDLISTILTNQATGVQPDKPYSALVDSYRSWVYTSVDKIAKTVAMLPLHLYVYRNQNGKKEILPSSMRTQVKGFRTPGEEKYFLKENGLKKEEVFAHPFLELMNRPNHLMSRFILWYETIIRLELAGQCGWYMPRNKLGIPGQIWPMPLAKTAELKPVVTSDMIITSWHYQDGDIRTQIPPELMLMHRYPSPISPFHGMSPLMAQTYPYDLDLYFMQQQTALYKNKGLPGLHLHTEQNLTKPQIQDMKRMLTEQFGGAVKSGLPFITHSGFKADKTGFSPRENMVDEIAKYAREKIITSYDLSEGKLGLVSDVNRANAEALDDTFVKECLKPKCMLIEENIEAFLLPLYDEGLCCDFVLPDTGDKEHRLKERETNLKMFFTSINEEREKEGKKPVAWGDTPWGSLANLQLGKTRLGEDAPGPGSRRAQAQGNAPKKELTTETKAETTTEEDRRRQTWQAFVIRSGVWERMLQDRMTKYFRHQGAAVIERLFKIGPRVESQYAGWSRKRVQEHIATKAGPLDEINIVPGNEAEGLTFLFREPMLAMLEGEAIETLKSLRVPTFFNAQDPKVLEWLGDRMKMFSEEVTGTTFDIINATLREGFAEGKPVSAIADILREKFDAFEQYRAPLIARTETIAGMNRANLFATEQAGLDDVLLKTWISAGDAHTRPTHIEAEARYEKGIPLDEAFVVGGDRMLAPGNGSDAAENINCRCNISYVRKEEGAAQGADPGAEEFVPAKTVDDAVDRLKTFIRSGGYIDKDLRSTKLSTINSMLRATEDTLGKYKTKVDDLGFIKTKGKNIGVCLSGYNPSGPIKIHMRKSFISNPEKYKKLSTERWSVHKERNIESISNYINTLEGKLGSATGSQRENLVMEIEKNKLLLDRTKKTNVFNTIEYGSDPIYTAYKHECYHAVMERQGLGNIFRDKLTEHDAWKMVISEYAKANPSEMFAELGTAIDIGMDIPKPLVDVFMETMKGIK